jgi:hypothetical protein
MVHTKAKEGSSEAKPGDLGFSSQIEKPQNKDSQFYRDMLN